MCTISAIYAPDGTYCVTMNRDEQRDRAAEHPPHWVSKQILAPLDGTAGGTWFAVRPDGCWAALLNGYAQRDATIHGRRSRGELPLLALAEKTPLTLGTLDNLSDFPSFRLLVGCSEKYIEWLWDGEQLTTIPAVYGGSLMRSSSSYRQTEVIAHRRVAFDHWRMNEFEHKPGEIPIFHRNQSSGEEAMSVLMEREKAATRSIVQLVVEPSKRASLFYWPVINSKIGKRHSYCLSYGH